MESIRVKLRYKQPVPKLRPLFTKCGLKSHLYTNKNSVCGSQKPIFLYILCF